MDKKKIVLIVIILVVLVIVGIAGYNFASKDKNNDKNEYKLSTLDFSSCDFENDEICSKKFDNVNLSIIKDNNEETYSLKMDDKEILKDIFFPIKKVDVLDGNIIFQASMGTDIRTTAIYAFDKSGKELLNIFNTFDNKYPNYSMTVDDFNGDIDDLVYEIKDNSITFKGTRLFHGPSIVPEEESDNEPGSFYDISTCDKAKKYKDEIVEGEYKVDYLGNNKFSPLVNKKYTALKDSKTYNDICK